MGQLRRGHDIAHRVDARLGGPEAIIYLDEATLVHHHAGAHQTGRVAPGAAADGDDHQVHLDRGVVAEPDRRGSIDRIVTVDRHT